MGWLWRVTLGVIVGTATKHVTHAIGKTLPWLAIAVAAGVWWLLAWMGPWWPVLPAAVALLILWRPLLWLALHPVWPVTGAFTVTALMQWGPHAALVAAPATYLAWTGAVVALLLLRGTARGLSAILTALSRYVKVRLRWNATCSAVQPTLISKVTGGPVPVYRWVLTSRGLQANVNVGALGKHAREAQAIWATSLSAVLNIPRVRFTPLSAGVAVMSLEWGEHLRDHLALLDIPECTRPGKYVCIGISEDGTGLEVPIGSWLIAAMSGMGKSSFVWTYLFDLIRQEIPFELVIVDPKRVEWSAAERHLDESPIVRAYAGHGSEWGNRGLNKGGWLVENVEQLIDDRLVEYAANGHRDHVPTAKSPLVMVIVDETLPMAKALRTKGEEHPLAMAAFMGRAIGVIVVFLTQITEKDVVGAVRDMLPNRAAGRLLSADQVDMALGHQASKRGAEAHLLHPVEDRGVFYIQTDDGQIVAGRLGFATDEDTEDLIMGRLPQRRVVRAARDPFERRDCYVYHLFDHLGHRIYIGKAFDPVKRLAQHLADEHDWSGEIDPEGMVVDSKWDCEAAALDEEARQIRRAARDGEELYNVMHNGGRRRLRPVPDLDDPWKVRS